MEDASIIVLFLFVLFLLLGSGVWVGLSLIGVAWVGMELSRRGQLATRC